MFAIGSGDQGAREWSFYDPETKDRQTGTAAAFESRSTVPVMERLFTRTGNLGPAVENGIIAKAAVRKLSGGRSGILLLNNKHVPIGYLPVDAAAAAELRKDGRLRNLYRNIAESGASAAILASVDQELSPNAARNLGTALTIGGLELHVLDIVFWDQATDSATTVTATDGDLRLPSTFAQNSEAPRGSFNPATNTVSLLQAADLSTFLHESAHFFLEVQFDMASRRRTDTAVLGAEGLTGAQRQVIRDADAILRWFGLDSLEAWAALSFEEKRSYHERYAESFERYLLEGEAPSIELQPLFARFRSWLVAVYRSLRDFLARNPDAGNLNDEVRQVFDRLLATDEQIELAEQGQSMRPLFETPEQAGMTPAEFADYQAQRREATDEARQDLQARSLRDLQWARNARTKMLSRLQREAEAQRREVRARVRAEVMAEPVYRAWQFLTAKLKPEEIDYKRLDVLVKFITPTGKIEAARRTGATRKQQTRVVRAIKRARFLALVPYTIDDTR